MLSSDQLSDNQYDDQLQYFLAHAYAHCHIVYDSRKKEIVISIVMKKKNKTKIYDLPLPLRNLHLPAKIRAK